jgi:hypothetical protein
MFYRAIRGKINHSLGERGIFATLRKNMHINASLAKTAIAGLLPYKVYSLCMSTQAIVSIVSPPKPKVFRIPPALPATPVIQSQAVRSGRFWQWGVFLLALSLIWPVSYAMSSLSRVIPSTQADRDGLEGILQPPVSDAQASIAAEKPPTILLRGQSEAIIGQMAKIPAENEPVIETRAISAVDNNAGRELLSIISKY